MVLNADRGTSLVPREVLTSRSSVIAEEGVSQNEDVVITVAHAIARGCDHQGVVECVGGGEGHACYCKRASISDGVYAAFGIPGEGERCGGGRCLRPGVVVVDYAKVGGDPAERAGGKIVGAFS